MDQRPGDHHHTDGDPDDPATRRQQNGEERKHKVARENQDERGLRIPVMANPSVAEDRYLKPLKTQEGEHPDQGRNQPGQGLKDHCCGDGEQAARSALFDAVRHGRADRRNERRTVIGTGLHDAHGGSPGFARFCATDAAGCHCLAPLRAIRLSSPLTSY